MPQVKLHAGTIEYEDSGGDGPAVVLLHGLLMDSTAWRHVVPLLAGDCRVITPTLPLGAHRLAMRPGADLSLAGQAAIIADLLDALNLGDATVVSNDWAGSMLLPQLGRTERIARLVFISVEAFENYPPGIAGKVAWLTAFTPAGWLIASRLTRWSRFRNSPLVFGSMSHAEIPAEIAAGWLRPVSTQRAIRQDLNRYVRRVRRNDLLMAARYFERFDGPVLVLWGADDIMMPIPHARRLAEAFPNGRHELIPCSRTLVPEDQPAALADQLRAFVS
jgi:pimeloyl-ACP methyl ester carboxylesterase